jgi:DNA-binding NtrC family response regulator
MKHPKRVSKSILVIDDDRIFCDTIQDEFQDTRTAVALAHTGKDGLAILGNQHVDVVLLDQKLPDIQGHELCGEILKKNEHAKIIFITAYPSFNNAVNAIKAGAHDYLSKPFELEELHLVIKNAFELLGLEKVKEFHNYKQQKEQEKNILVGRMGGDNDIHRLIDMAASTTSTVLITGETGTGKNMVAKAIHYKANEAKSDAPFFSLNCGALPESLIEAELFGYEKGAFTGAVSSKKGVFELAEGGTLFLDEIGTMPLHLQSRLLGVLDDGKLKRLGGQTIISVNPRIIAATNANPEEMIAGQTLRQDLFYRLSVLSIHLPALGDRLEDIPSLCRHFVTRAAGNKEVVLPPEEIEKLQQYDWPGNIRELKNIIERSLILHRDTLHPSRLIFPQTQQAPPQIQNRPTPDAPPKTLEQIEKEHIALTLNMLSNNLSQTARALGISLSTLKRKTRQYGLR